MSKADLVLVFRDLSGALDYESDDFSRKQNAIIKGLMVLIGDRVEQIDEERTP